MTSRSSVTQLVDRSPLACRHHWVIQPAAGPLSPGVCQICGAQREFKNFVEDPSWDEYNLVFRSLVGGSKVMAREVKDHEEFQKDEEG